MKVTKRSKRPDWLRHVLRLSRSSRPTTEVGYCLRETREVLGAGPGAPDAIGAWNAAQHKHPVPSTAKIPPGAPLFWSGGSAGHGHVAVKAFKRGQCWTVDFERPGYWNRVRIDDITTDWHLTFLGWPEDINGVRVYTPPKEVKK